MRFIKSTERVPTDSDYKNCRLVGVPIILFYSEYNKRFHDLNGVPYKINDDLEWLDESGPSLDISDIGSAWMHCCELWEERSGKCIPPELFHKYMKDKYDIDINN